MWLSMRDDHRYGTAMGVGNRVLRFYTFRRKAKKGQVQKSNIYYRIVGILELVRVKRNKDLRGCGAEKERA